MVVVPIAVTGIAMVEQKNNDRACFPGKASMPLISLMSAPILEAEAIMNMHSKIIGPESIKREEVHLPGGMVDTCNLSTTLNFNA